MQEKIQKKIVEWKDSSQPCWTFIARGKVFFSFFLTHCKFQGHFRNTCLLDRVVLV